MYKKVETGLDFLKGGVEMARSRKTKKRVSLFMTVVIAAAILFSPFYKNGIILDFFGIAFDNPFVTVIE
ncbi:hypothetical protein, partial [Pseudomonas sp. 2995-1]|uniref:hypothetical protein n=1 Tax=Pseudomonas sp. 2995-1 TaxID=1712679 RepID=UPI001C495E02